ncbi:MAG TPA: tetratricopeptide repeat protein, partial [Candidatus Acidoferrales bacterium]|nr:tetratricopeptide repeat protein [Candidatus Acidoferrales bacterium]
ANLGVVAMRRKQWDSALSFLRKAEQLDPKMSGIRLNIALVQFHRADYTAAIPPLRTVLRDEPQSEQARYLLGLCQVLSEKFGDAVSTLQPLYDARSSDVLYLYVFDIAAHGSGQKELDDRILGQMVRAASDTPEFHLLMGKARLNRQDMPQAIDELQKAAAAKNDLAYVHFELGMAYLMQGKADEAEAEFRKDIAVEPDLPDNYEQLGVVYLRIRQPQKARESFEKALKLDAQRAGPYLQLAQLAFDDKRDQEALRQVDAALHLDSNIRGGHLLRGRVLARLGRRQEAQTEFAKAKLQLASGLEKDRESLEKQQFVDPALKQQP